MKQACVVFLHICLHVAFCSNGRSRQRGIVLHGFVSIRFLPS